MSPTTFKPTDDQELFDGKKRLTNVVRIEYRTNHLKHDADARQLQLSPGDQVIAQARFGPVIAEVKGHIRRELVKREEIPQILRKAHQSDLKRAASNEELESQAYRFCLERIRARELSMKLIRTQSMQDRSRLIFFFSADGRIDFRNLVRDLAREFRTRIEMYQIGVRDGAQMIGGIGPCGRELCCSTFLDHFEPISIRMARQQGLTLSPDKISGRCGRLMCCLVYEQVMYRRLRTRLPQSGDQVDTEHGRARVKDVDVIGRTVDVEVLDAQEHKTLSIAEITAVKNEPSTGLSSNESAPEPDKLWDDKPPRKRDPADDSPSDQ